MTSAHPLPRKRGLAVAAVGIGLPVLAHVGAGGSVSVPPVAVLPLTLAAVLCVTASAKTWTLPRLTVALAGLGLTTHAALWMGHTTHAGGGPTPLHAHHEGADAAALTAQVAPGPAGGTDSSAGPLAELFGFSAPMLAAHLAAVLLAVVLLRHGETLLLWLWSVAQRVLRPAGSLVTLPSATTSPAWYRCTSLAGFHALSGDPRAPPQPAFA